MRVFASEAFRGVDPPFARDCNQPVEEAVRPGWLGTGFVSGANRVRTAVYLLTTSPQFSTQR